MCQEQDHGHVERKEEDWMKKCLRMNVTGVVDRGAPSERVVSRET